MRAFAILAAVLAAAAPALADVTQISDGQIQNPATSYAAEPTEVSTPAPYYPAGNSSSYVPPAGTGYQPPYSNSTVTSGSPAPTSSSVPSSVPSGGAAPIQKAGFFGVAAGAVAAVLLA